MKHLIGLDHFQIMLLGWGMR